jgi:hypothetical protein
MSIKSIFKSSGEAKRAGWFSRRHETNKEHLMAHELKIKKKNKGKNL